MGTLKSQLAWRGQHRVVAAAVVAYILFYFLGKLAGGEAPFNYFMAMNGVLATVAMHTNYLAAKYGNPARRGIFGIITAVCALYAVTYAVGDAAFFSVADWSRFIGSYAWVAWLVMWQIHARWSIWAATLKPETPLRVTMEATVLTVAVAMTLGLTAHHNIDGPTAILALNAVLAAHAAYTNLRAATEGQMWARPHFGATAAIASFYSAWYIIGAAQLLDRGTWSEMASGFGWVVWLYVAQVHARESLRLADQLRAVVHSDPERWVARLSGGDVNE